MSAQQIPNLLSLRGGPRLRGSRGRGRGRPGETTHSSSAQRKDLSIQSTDTDASVSRLSAVSLGYLDDPFAQFFVAPGQETRRMPIINRGTYTRTTALDLLIDAFLSHIPTQTKQIISLGAGTDTRYFRLRAQNKHRNVIYHEFDFPSVSEQKRRTMFGNPLLSKLEENETLFPNHRDPPALPGEERSWGFRRKNREGDHEAIYNFHPIDLRQLKPPPDNSHLQFEKLGLERDIPTLIISECCLCYLEVQDSRDVVKWFADSIPDLGIVLYEPIGVDDSFGQMMVANLAARNITMPSLKAYKAAEDQKARLRELGFGNSAEAETIERIWNEWIGAEEKERVDSLEGLDEVEEWQMLARHYAVVWGWRGTGFEGWKALLKTNFSRNIGELARG